MFHNVFMNKSSLLCRLQLLFNDTDAAFNVSGIFEAQGPVVSTTVIKRASYGTNYLFLFLHFFSLNVFRDHRVQRETLGCQVLKGLQD